MTVLFLYTELADYFLKCCEELSKSCSVHIVRWPVNKEAPFKFNYPEGIKIYDKNEYDREKLRELVKKIDPSMIVCSGWIDKDYLSITRSFRKKIPTVLTCDTHWSGSARQQIARLLSRLFLLNTFTYAWVPGKAQAGYARKLGFPEKHIRQGFYSCDLKKFNKMYQRLGPSRAEDFPKRFLYVGRYYDFKGVTDLWNAFIEVKEEFPNEWELWCLGTGDITPVNHPAIKHYGFVQPGDLEPVISKTGVFVLPSRFEPWGVVVHEYASAGFPLLLSNEVGAKESFLEDGKNGFIFNAGDPGSLKEALKKMINLNGDQLNLMSRHSHGLAQKISPLKWAATAIEMYDNFKK